MIDLFGRLRRKAAEAIVLGCSDGFRAVTPEGEPVPTDLNELRAMLAGIGAEPKALAAAVAEEKSAEGEPAGKRKAK
ncbi:MAG: hypothetical protein K8U57_19600 [Planctomycetes bacterium]|nr:hypothetical protein [Planctomycetota bacterium]